MKMNKKIIVSTLALAMGAALAGSVSGTVAWYQYSTRAQGSYIGSSGHCSEMLYVKNTDKTNAEWVTEFKSADLVLVGDSSANPAIVGGSAIQPITTGAFDGTGAATAAPTFYKNPVYQYADQASWGTANVANYAQFNLSFHVLDIDGASTAKYLEKNLYLTGLDIVTLDTSNGTAVDTTSDAKDLNKAVRVMFEIGTSGQSGYMAKVFSLDGGDTATAGALDLNNDGQLDKAAYYEWEAAPTSNLTYGAGVQKTIKADKVANDADLGDFAAADATAADSRTDAQKAILNDGFLGAIDDAENGLAIKVTIWVEGWQKLAKEPTDNASEGEIWDPAVYVGKSFGVGLRFSVPLHADNQ